MGRQAPRFRETQQHRLRKLIGMQIRQLLGLRQSRNQRARTDHPAHAQPRERDLGKTAQQNHVAAVVQSL